MKKEKCIFIIMLFTSIVALAIYLVPFGNSERTNEICLAIFGGSIVASVVALIEYLQEREKTLEQFISDSRETIRNFRKIKYLSLDYPEELIIDCIKEEEDNFLRPIFNKPELDIAKKKILDYSVRARNQSDIDEKLAEKIKDDVIDKMGSENMYKAILGNAKEQIKNSMRSYIDASNFELKKLETSYENLCFIIHNKKIKQKINDKIVLKIKDYQKLINEKQFIFKDDINRLMGVAKACEELFALNKRLFRTEECRENNLIHNYVYQECIDEIEQSIESARNMILFRKEESVLEKKPVYIIHETLTSN